MRGGAVERQVDVLRFTVTKRLVGGFKFMGEGGKPKTQVQG